jgi:hypothetical protein
MKKSKVISIGLLALSIAACTSNEKRKRKAVDEFGQPIYYVDNGNGYNRGGVSPMWIYWMYSMGSNNRIMSNPTYVGRSYGRNGTYHATSFGKRTTLTRSSFSKSSSGMRSSISRGGFGHSSSHASS